MKNKFKYKLFADCGAPSLYNKLSRKVEKKGVMGSTFAERKFDDFSYTETEEYAAYRDSYIDFLVENKDNIDVYSNLDVINNPVLTYKNQRLLEDAGLSPIPVYHLGTDVKWLKRYIDRYEYIALGGLIPNPTKVLIPILDEMFKKYLTDDKGFPRVKLHGFACTSMPLMLRYPWYSVDSTTCRKLAIYGSIVIPEFSREKLVTLSVSSRDVPLEQRLSPIVIQEIEKRMVRFGMTMQSVSERDIERAAWNYLIFSEKLQKLLPKWPWSILDRKSKQDAQEMMSFYFAGVLSLKDELEFWRIIEGKEIESVTGRLQSFFYATQLKQAINLKQNNNENE